MVSILSLNMQFISRLSRDTLLVRLPSFLPAILLHCTCEPLSVFSFRPSSNFAAMFTQTIFCVFLPSFPPAIMLLCSRKPLSVFSCLPYSNFAAMFTQTTFSVFLPSSDSAIHIALEVVIGHLRYHPQSHRLAEFDLQNSICSQGSDSRKAGCFSVLSFFGAVRSFFGCANAFFSVGHTTWLDDFAPIYSLLQQANCTKLWM